jgi:hypothetical protein
MGLSSQGVYYGQRRARNYAGITRNGASFSEITKNTAKFDDTIYRNTPPGFPYAPCNRMEHGTSIRTSL